LHIFLALLLSKKETTIWQSNPETLLLFTPSGPYEIEPKEGFALAQEFITRGTWALIDASPDFQKPASFLNNAGIYFKYVLATSPHSMHWTTFEKTGGAVAYYFVEPWSLADLIAA
jgi:hypothetical protein